ncbi:hypothetical protein V7S43_017669 [Phytophthora oleae]|uniref:C2 domain-containing protein n=1 Tax=Phytophthora oleae TaxID=2107226 RepID=A0ABD3ETF8_9STRA
MGMSEDEAEVEALLKQIAAAKQKELRLRVEKKRIQDELGQLQAGILWTREKQTQKQLLGVRQAKEQLETQKKTEQEKLLKLCDSLKEQEQKFRKAKSSPFQLAAASVVITSPQVAEESSQKENANLRQKISDEPKLFGKVSPLARSASGTNQETSTQNDSLQLLVRNCDEQQKRVERIQVELEKANSRRQEFNFAAPSSTAKRHSSDDYEGRDYSFEPEYSSHTAVVREVANKPVHLTPLGGPQLPNYRPNASDSPATSTHPLDNVLSMQPTALPTAQAPPYPVHFAAGYPPNYPVATAYPLFSPMMPINPYAIGFAPQCFSASPYLAHPWLPSHTGSVLPLEQPAQPRINRQEEEIRRIGRELDMQRTDNEQQAEAKEFARIQSRLQDLQTRISTLTGTDNSSVDSVDEAVADDKNDPALSSLKRQHLESLAKVRNERDLLEEQEKLEELKERIQRRREEKRRELDHEEWIAKQKRELVSLRLQRVIQRDDVKKDALCSDIQAESAGVYNPESGFALLWDFATGVPAAANELQITYAVFEGKIIRTPFKIVCAKEIKATGLQHKQCLFLSSCHIKRLITSSELRVIMEVASVAQNGIGDACIPTSLGWTAFDIFKPANESELVLNCGYFKLPVRQSSMPDPSKILVCAPQLGECGDMRIHIRLMPGDRIEEASQMLVEPELHAARYQLPDTGSESLRPQSKGVKTRRPSIQGRRTPSAKSTTPLNDQKTVPPTPKQDFLDVDRLRSLSTASSRPPSTLPGIPPTGDRPRLPPFREDEADEPWIRVDNALELQRRLLGGNPFQSGDGFNVFIDGGRGFPDSTTISKVTIAALDANRSQVAAENGSEFAAVTSNAFDPEFDTYVEYRQSSFNPTLTLVIRVDTIELVSKRPVILGYCVFPVFIDVESRDQPIRPSIPQFILNEGGFQLPLHTQVQTAEANQPLSAKSCEEFPRVPCATLLLRIARAKLSGDGMTLLSRKDFPPHEWETNGLLAPSPQYIDQVYDSLLSVPSGIEEKIYSIRQKNRRPKTVAQCLQQMSLSSSETREMLKTKPPNYLDLSSALRYEPAIGFRVAVDALHNVKAKGGPFFKVLFSVYPPGSFYQTIRLTGNVYFTTTMDWASSQTSPVFSDGYMTLRDLPSDQLLLVLFDVRSLTRHPKTGAFTSQQYGWTFLPVLANSRSVDARSVQLPLFQGDVNLGVLKAAVGGLNNLVDDIGSEMVKALVPVADEGASLFVQLQDPQLPLFSSQPIVEASLSKMIPPRLRSKYAYDSVKIAALKKKTPLSKLLPTNIPDKQFEKELNQAFAKEMGIYHLLF